MSEFQILDEKRYPLKVKDTSKDFLPYWRYEHRATIGKNLKEFMVFVDNLESKVFIEEITGGHLEIVGEDSLWHALYEFSKNKGFCNMMMPMMKSSTERFM